MISRIITAGIVAGVLAAAPAAADVCPDSTVRLVVTFPAGGAADSIARIVSDRLAARLGKSVIVENVAGAAGTLGTAAVARSPANGCTLLVAFDTHVVNASLKPNLPYDAYRDFSGVTLVGTAPLVMVGTVGRGPQTAQDLLTTVRSSDVTFGSIGVGSLGHLAAQLIGSRNSLRLTHVPYRGGSFLIQDLLGGHVPLGIGSTALFGTVLDAKSITPLFVTGASRSATMPNIPTAIELGLVDAPLVSWWAFVVKSGTPSSVIQRLHREVTETVAETTVRDKLVTLGIDMQVTSPERTDQFIQAEGRRWDDVIRTNNLREAN
jgi:tripartite-type tricarboxylate transporter receptor subunit TctC